MSFLGYFSSLGGLSALNVLVTDWITKACKIQKGWVKQIISWLIPVVLSVLGFSLGLGLFAGYGALTTWTGWIYTILTGFGAGLVSNGLYDITFVQNALDWITNLIKRKNTDNNENVVTTIKAAAIDEQIMDNRAKMNDDAIKDYKEPIAEITKQSSKRKTTKK